MMVDDELTGVSYLIQNVINYGKIMKAVWRKECGSKDPNWILGKSQCCEFGKDMKAHAEKAKYGINCRCYNSKQ